MLSYAIFGGSFDPIHTGHLILAEWCRDALRLDRVFFVPTAISPMKPGGSRSTPRARMEMVQLALAGHDQMIADATELERGGVSYTVDTLAHFAERYPEATCYFMMGADSLESFHKWREPHRICSLAIPVVMARHSYQQIDIQQLASLVSPERMQTIAAAQLDYPIVGLSSRLIRQRVTEGKSIRYLVPRSVEKYIETHGLYGPAPE